MSLNFPWRDIASDFFKNFVDKTYMIITDHYLPIKTENRPHFRSPRYQIFTTSVGDCKELGSVHPPYQQASGYQCHGETKIPVKVPYVGQPLWFWNETTQKSSFSGQRVLRIYYRPIDEVISNPLTHLRNTLGTLTKNNNAVEFTGMRVTTLTENSYDSFFLHVLTRATYLIKDGGSAFRQEETRDIFELIKSYGIDKYVVFDSGLIAHKDGRIHISDALLYLFMEAIHRAKPMATFLNKNGLLQITNKQDLE